MLSDTQEIGLPLCLEKELDHEENPVLSRADPAGDQYAVCRLCHQHRNDDFVRIVSDYRLSAHAGVCALFGKEFLRVFPVWNGRQRPLLLSLRAAVLCTHPALRSRADDALYRSLSDLEGDDIRAAAHFHAHRCSLYQDGSASGNRAEYFNETGDERLYV
ncbi:hypothetical protein [Allobaculum sp. Allo2]|uniref:hypothetical protein n=1 Tax=Allobaculum sp. Allo2 TaxID=2853432 RepID=UPI001F623119|nr:hypothetical protein [Allobaculum sp. Allo2]UNT92153.1 hypothetical protein KWG61_07845 [Allobaculum sp. Allo2]